MPDPSMSSASAWMATENLPVHPPLIADTAAQVCVVGAGITGLMTAYLLAKAGKSAVLLDRHGIGSGETGRTTAHLSNALDRRYYELQRLHGKEGARLAAASHTAAIDRLQAIVDEEQIACDFERVDGFLFVDDGRSLGKLKRELRAAQEAGLPNVEFVSRAPLVGFDTGACLRFPDQAQCHPLRFLVGLAQAFERLGGRIYGGSYVNEVQGGKHAYAQTREGARVEADAIVIATNVPFNDRFVVHTKQAPYRTYALGIRVPRKAVQRALYWDTADPYHYVRVQEYPGDAESEVLIVGGEDHKTGQPPNSDPYELLEGWTRERFPRAGAVAFRWSGQVLEPVDGLAYIGHNPGDETNVYIATGDAGMGMTHGAIAGMLLSDLICGKDNPWQQLYDPARKWTSSLRDYASENLNVAAQYFDWFTAGQVNSAHEVRPGTGAVLREGLAKICVYRDEHGVAHRCSAVCPHLGCIVSWNAAEHSWDCPCHGSRFDPYGQVIQGPATSDLAPVGEHVAAQ